MSDGFFEFMKFCLGQRTAHKTLFAWFEKKNAHFVIILAEKAWWIQKDFSSRGERDMGVTNFANGISKNFPSTPKNFLF